MKKIMGILMVMVLTLAGCGSSTETPDGPVDLEFATWAGGEELEQLQAVVDKVNEENADTYHITVNSVPSDYMIKMQTQFSAGQGPDIMWIEQNQLAPVASQGILLPTEGTAADTELAEYNFNEALLGTASYQGTQYGIPWVSNPMVMYYNKDMVTSEDQARLDEAITGDKLSLEEFAEMARAYNSDDSWGAVMNGWPPFEYFLWNFGGEVEDAEGNIAFNSAEGLAAVDYLQEILVNNPITADMEAINNVGYTETFQAGKTAFLMGGVADGIELVGGEELPFEVGYTVVPGDYTYNWSASYAVTKDAEYPEIAFQAVADLTKATWEWKVVPPVAIGDLGYTDYEDYLSKHAPEKAGMGTVIEAALEQTKDYTYSPNSSKIYGAIWDQIFDPIMNGRITGNEVDSQTLLDNAQNAVESE